MNSIIISLIPTAFLLLLGAAMWYSDPWVRAQRAVARTSQCVGCGATHRRTNECDGSFSAFCSADCHEATMEHSRCAVEDARGTFRPPADEVLF